MEIRNYVVERTLGEGFSYEYRGFNGTSGMLRKALEDVNGIVEVTGDNVLNGLIPAINVLRDRGCSEGVIQSEYGGQTAARKISVEDFTKWTANL